MKAETYIRALFGVLFACAFVGCHNDIENEIKSFMTQRIDMPYQEMERKICSKFYDNRVSSNAIFIVNYIDSKVCGSCELSRIAEEEKNHIDYLKSRNVHFMYVFETNSARMTTLYYELCNNRLEGIVYIDTTGVFKRRNTHIPENKLFHTFVMSNDGKVLLVGNPFTNERMNSLFNKIVGKHKASNNKATKSQ